MLSCGIIKIDSTVAGSTIVRFLVLVLSMFFLCGVFAKTHDKQAIFAGGCFWCMQSDFDKLQGITKTTVGYDGGVKPMPTYEVVSSGVTSYAESISVQYDPNKISYADLLKYYWQHIDPTVQNKQFCDVGEQYRSIIFYSNSKQKRLAIKSLDKVKALFPKVFTQILPTTHFYDAEAYHQDYYLKNPVRYHFYRWNCGRDQRVATVWKNKTLS